MNRSRTHSAAGFSLLEMAIVLLIVGLIVGVIVLGQSYISQAGLRRIMGEIADLKIAVNQFQAEYNAVPGDFSKATTVWYSASPAPANGNGDGNVSLEEETYAFHHLMLAGFINGNYQSGYYNAPATQYWKTGYNLKGSAVRDTIHYMYGTPWIFEIRGGNNGMLIGYFGSNYLAGGLDAIFTVTEASLIDTKMDDGKAYTGGIYAIDGVNVSGGSCSNAWNSMGGVDYNLSATGINCYLAVWTDK